MTACDRCGEPATWLAFAAYDTGNPAGDDIHPRLARYPAPLVRACTDHLAALVLADAATDLSTGQWVLVTT